jgi:hypothetical protein
MDLFKRLSQNSDNIEQELVDIKNINIVKNYIKNKKISPKILLTTLLFYHNVDNIALIVKDKSLTEEILDISKKIVEKIINGEYPEELFSKYKETFLRWKLADIKQKEFLIERIKTNTSKLMKQAFWDKVYEDLGKKENENIRLLLIELKENIKGLCLKDSMKDSIDKQFDIDIIKQIIDNDKMSERDFDMFFGNLSKTVRSLQSPVNDKDLDKAIEVIKSQIGNDWREAFVSSMKVLSEAVSQIYVDLIKLDKKFSEEDNK